MPERRVQKHGGWLWSGRPYPDDSIWSTSDRLPDDALQQAIWQWDDDEFARDQLSIPSTAAGLCVDASEAFVAYLRDSGFSAEVVDIPGQAHTVVESQGFVIDWTARQLDETADIPVVEPVDVYYARFKGAS